MASVWYFIEREILALKHTCENVVKYMLSEVKEIVENQMSMKEFVFVEKRNHRKEY